jgi:hypothetical protein
MNNGVHYGGKCPVLSNDFKSSMDGLDSVTGTSD